jgi:selenide, water dikinase
LFWEISRQIDYVEGYQQIERITPVKRDSVFRLLNSLSLMWRMAEARVSRTHRRPRRTTTGFEDRGDHRSPGTSVAIYTTWQGFKPGSNRDISLENASSIRLTQQVKAGGCASKLAPGSLRAVLDRLPEQNDQNLLVGFETSDDAGIYRIAPDAALVQTVDFFTPLVDDPFTFGLIAAANALSDVYAMGGRPLTSLAVVCFPQDGDMGVLEQIMRGGLTKMTEAGCIVAGGHTVRDAEIKFGYAVTGMIHPARIFTNAGAMPGDDLILTKAIGTGVITTALKQGKAERQWVEDAIRSMTTLNRTAAEVIMEVEGVHGMTDITGFGLMGHGREMAMASGVTLEIEVEAVPRIEGALEAIRLQTIPAGLLANRDFAECVTAAAPGSYISDELRTLMFDPQTSGPLLISVATESSEPLRQALRDAGVAAERIGRVSGVYSAGSGKPAIILR